MADLMSQYGPFYGGLLQRQLMQQDQANSEAQQLGILSQAMRSMEQNRLIQQQVEIAKLKAAKEAEMQAAVLPMIRRIAGGGQQQRPTGPVDTTFRQPDPLTGQGGISLPVQPQQQSGFQFPISAQEAAVLGMAGVPGASNITQARRAAFDEYKHGNMSAAELADMENKRERLDLDRQQYQTGLINAAPATVRVGGRDYQVEQGDLQRYRQETKNPFATAADYVRSRRQSPAPQTGVQQPGPAPAQSFDTSAGPEPFPTPEEKIKKETTARIDAETWAKRYQNFHTAALNAPVQISQLMLLGDLLNKAGTGPMTEGINKFSEILRQIGVDTKSLVGVPFADAAAVISNRMAIKLRGMNDDGGTGMPGAMSDNDLKFLKASIPSIDKNPKGNKLAIAILVKLEERKQDIAALAENYKRKYGTLDGGFTEAVRQFGEARPMFAGWGGSTGQW